MLFVDPRPLSQPRPQALASAGAEVILGTWVPALNIFETSLRVRSYPLIGVCRIYSMALAVYCAMALRGAEIA